MKKLFAVVALAVMSVGYAFAADTSATDPLSYTYVQGVYQYDAVNGSSSSNLRGFGLSGSANLLDSPFYVEGSVDRYSNSLTTGGVNTYRLGVGVHFPVYNNVDVYGQAGVLHVGVANPTSFASYGYDLEGGVRAAVLNDKLEFKAGAQEEKINQGDNWTLYGVGEVLYNLTSNLALVGDLKASNQDRIWSGGLRVSF